MNGITAGSKIYDGTTLASLNTSDCIARGRRFGRHGHTLHECSLGYVRVAECGDRHLRGGDRPVAHRSRRGNYSLTEPTTTADIMPRPT